jgi:hypothetical protein
VLAAREGLPIAATHVRPGRSVANAIPRRSDRRSGVRPNLLARHSKQAAEKFGMNPSAEDATVGHRLTAAGEVRRVPTVSRLRRISHATYQSGSATGSSALGERIRAGRLDVRNIPPRSACRNRRSASITESPRHHRFSAQRSIGRISRTGRSLTSSQSTTTAGPEDAVTTPPMEVRCTTTPKTHNDSGSDSD